MEKLIIIRGPSGAGKTTVARTIKDRSDRPTVLVEQDQFRLNFNDQSNRSSLPAWQMIETCTIIGLEHGFDVVLEGILNVKKPERRQMYDRLFESHPEENYVFYMDVSFPETVRRHDTRPDKKAQFSAEQMLEWYDMASPMEHARETVVPESSTFEETVSLIGKVAGLKLEGNT